jgi:energy-coupling factor transport system permease protein
MMNGKMIFGQYYNANSVIHRLDPRTKLICLFVWMLAIFLLTSIYSLLAMFAIVLAIVIIAKMPLKRFLQSFKMMTMILVFVVFFQIIFTQSGEVIASFAFDMRVINLIICVALLVLYYLSGKIIRKFRLLTFLAFVVLALYLQTIITATPSLFTYQLKIYDSGVLSAVKIILRITNLICISSLLTLTTKPTDLNNGLESVCKPLKYIGVNVSILAMMISIALRFIPTLINEANRILKAQASRGVDFKEGKLKDKVVQIISLLIPMIVIAYKRAEDLANAMEARGYIPGAPRTKVNELKYSKFDAFAFTFTIVLVSSIIVLKFFYAI